MTVTERLMKPGTFSVRLREDFPWSASAAVDYFDHIVVTPTRLDPIAGFSDANILDAAIYTGVVTAKPSPRIFEGAGLAWWLGDDNGIGDLIDLTGVSHSASTLSTWITDLCPSSLTVGTVTNTGLSTWSAFYQLMSPREAIDGVCRGLGAEYRVNPDFTIDAAKSPDLFVSTPTTVVTRKEEGQDGSYRGLEASLMVSSGDVSQYTTAVTAVAAGAGAAIPVSTSTGSTSYKDGLNNTLVRSRIANAPSDTTTTAATATANALVSMWNQVRRGLSLSSRTYTVTRFVRPGDYVYAYDQLAQLTDAANQITYRGELISPIKLRVYALTWPVERGMGVYARRSGATPTYTDLTDFVEWEDGTDVVWDVGTSARAANDTDAATAGSTAYLGANAEVASRLTGVVPSCGYQAAFSTTGSDGTLTNATLDTLFLGTETRDTDGFATAGSSSAVTIPTGKGGVYAITVHCEQTASGTGTDGYMAVVLTGTYARTIIAPAFSAQGTYEWSGTLRLAAADTITCKIKQNAGVDKTLSGNSFISVERIGD